MGRGLPLPDPQGAPSLKVPARKSGPELSVVITLRNEESVLPVLLERLEKSLPSSVVSSYEIIFVNDVSTDRSKTILEKKAALDPRVKILNTSRRFGVVECLIGGMRYASGEAVVTMDCDLQDPPELIGELAAKWKAGADVVYTLRKSRQGETAFKQKVTKWAYQILRAASREVDLPVESGDFRLLSRRALDELLKINERDPYLRGLVRTLGFRQEPVYYDRQPRHGGDSHFPVLSKGPVTTFLAGLLSFSTLPLTASFFIWIFLTSAMLLTAVLTASRPTEQANGFFFLILLGISIQFLCLGVMGLYLARVHRQLQGHPRIIFESAVNLVLESQDQEFTRSERSHE